MSCGVGASASTTHCSCLKKTRVALLFPNRKHDEAHCAHRAVLHRVCGPLHKNYPFVFSSASARVSNRNAVKVLGPCWPSAWTRVVFFIGLLSVMKSVPRDISPFFKRFQSQITGVGGVRARVLLEMNVPSGPWPSEMVDRTSRGCPTFEQLLPFWCLRICEDV